MVLDVAGALGDERVGVLFELGEDFRQRLPDDVGQDVQPAAVRHPDDRFLHMLVGCFRKYLGEHRDGGFGTLRARTACVRRNACAGSVRTLGRDQAAKGLAANLRRERDTRLWGLDPALDPGLFTGILDVPILDADLLAVGLAQDGQDLAQGSAFEAAEAAGDELAVEVPHGQPISGRVQFGVVQGMGAERIEVGDQMPTDAVQVDELQHSDLFFEVLTTDGAARTRPGCDRAPIESARRAAAGPRKFPRRTGRLPSSRSCTVPRYCPDSAPWMIRWS